MAGTKFDVTNVNTKTGKVDKSGSSKNVKHRQATTKSAPFHSEHPAPVQKQKLEPTGFRGFTEVITSKNKREKSAGV